MRADRLLSILLLLQTRGKMTAQQLASSLEVSERTIYRDINALGVAGVPVYGDPGPDGGYALLDRYRTDLTGLTEGETRALFMLSVPAPLVDLGLSEAFRGALLKLAAGLPEIRRGDEEKVRQRFHLDSKRWRHGREPVAHLGLVQQAIWEDRKLHVVYRPPFATEIEREVSPYGLVAKAGQWYMVGARNDVMNVHRISEMLDVRLSDETFARPEEFDLRVFWRDWCAEYEAYLHDFTATVRIAPDFIPELPMHFGNQVHAEIARAGSPDGEGWIRLDLTFESFETARARILSFGRGVKVLAPRALRRSVLDYAEQIVALYTG
jgi:predicted DNA-binding transcriptional regulator YafY